MKISTKPRLKMSDKWKKYQVGNDKTVAELSESEAKTELCKAIDLIEKMDTMAFMIGKRVDDWRDGK
jgi:hypothetical protein